MASLGLVACSLRGAGLSMLSRGFSAHLRTHVLRRSLFGYTLSERRGLRSTPHGFTYCKSSRERRVGSPVGQYLSSPLLVLCQSSLGTARLVSHRLVSAEPRALAATCPLGNCPVFPHFRRNACLSR